MRQVVRVQETPRKTPRILRCRMQKGMASQGIPEVLGQEEGEEDSQADRGRAMRRPPAWEFLTPTWARLALPGKVIYLSPEADPMMGPSLINRIKDWEPKARHVTVCCLEKDGLQFLKFSPPKRFMEVSRAWRKAANKPLDTYYGMPDFHHPECALKAIAVFRKRAVEWGVANAKIKRDFYQACYWLPFPKRSDPPGLSDYLFRWRRSRIENLRMVAECWPDMTDEMRKLAPPRIADALFPIVMKKHCPEARNMALCLEAYRSGHPMEKYLKLEKRWEKSQGVPPAFPDIRVEEGGLTGTFLKRSDPVGLFLGMHTDCCQYIGSVAESSAWNGQESPLGGFFVVKDAKGIIAQSWTWKTADGTSAVFDSIEAKAGDDWQEKRHAVASIYAKCAEKLLESGFLEVRVGPHEKLGDAFKTKKTRPIATPKRVYSDAKKAQYMLAKREG